MNRPIVFLYTELAQYIKACMDQLSETGLEVHVFAYPVNPEAPFKFDIQSSQCFFYRRNQFSNSELEIKIREIDPSVIVCSGWIDEGYISICQRLSHSVRTVLALDSQIEKGVKAKLAYLRAKYMYKSAFTDAWVPGTPQVEYATKLGFPPARIFEGFYTADTVKWAEMAPDLSHGKFPKRFVYMGRYVDFKGIRELWAAFEKLGAHDWQLYCAGQGELYANRKKMEGIHHLGFVQPTLLDTFVSRGGVFVLPSHREPWGVVLHEFSAAGFPIICTDNVGAASAFLMPGKNGFAVPPKSTEALETAMRKMMELTDRELIAMAKNSQSLAEKFTIKRWVKTALKLVEQNDE